jgi:pyruvate formate lyase activating enzyme
LVSPSGEENTIEASEILDFLKMRQGLLDGVCISGGEPFVHDDLNAFAQEVKALGFLVKVDTNGSFPDKLKALVESGLADHIALDIKNSPEKYPKACGFSEYDISPVKESVEFLMTGVIPYEFRTTVVRELHTAEDLLSIACWIQGADEYYLQMFTNSDKALQSGLSSYSAKEMEELLAGVREVLPVAKLRFA